MGAGGEGDDRGWDGWMASRTWWTWVWVNSGRWWWTGRPDVLWFMGSQRVGHDWATELNWRVWEGWISSEKCLMLKIKEICGDNTGRSGKKVSIREWRSPNILKPTPKVPETQVPIFPWTLSECFRKEALKPPTRPCLIACLTQSASPILVFLLFFEHT